MDKTLLIEDLKRAHETKLAANDAMVKRWGRIINPIERYFKDQQGRTLSKFDKHNMALCMENAADRAWSSSQTKRIFEATTEADIAFLGIQLPIIGVMMPSLILNEIGQVQALDRRQGAVFYMDLRYGTDKGAINAGDTMISARTGFDRTEPGRRYAIDKVFGEEITGSGDTKTGTFGRGVSWGSGIKLGTVVIKVNGTEVANDSAAAGVLDEVDSSGVTGVVSSAGVYSIDFSTDPGSSGQATADYQYTYDKVVDSSGNKTGVGQVNVHLTSETITAQDFTLKAIYSLGAALDLEKAHGVNFESEIVKDLANEIKFEIDHWGVDMILNAATGGRIWGSADNYSPADAITTWNAAVSTTTPWIWKKYELINRILKGSNNIYYKTLRGFGNFVIAGNDVARVIRQLEGHFKPDANLDKAIPTGPIKLGTLDGMTVVQDPLITSTRYVVGYKGDSYLFAGFIYAPYIPLFSTPSVTLADLHTQKGFMSSAGFKIINAGLYCYGDISGLDS